MTRYTRTHHPKPGQWLPTLPVVTLTRDLSAAEYAALPRPCYLNANGHKVEGVRYVQLP